MQWSNLPCLANHPNWPAAAQLWDMSRGHNRSFINTIARQAHLMQICGVFTHIDSSFSCRRRPGNLVPFSIFSQFQNFNSFFNCSHRDGAPYSQSWVHGPCVLQWPQSTYHAWSRKIHKDRVLPSRKATCFNTLRNRRYYQSRGVLTQSEKCLSWLLPRCND